MNTVAIQLTDDQGQAITQIVHVPREPRPFDRLDLPEGADDLLDAPATIRVRRVGSITQTVILLSARPVARDEQ